MANFSELANIIAKLSGPYGLDSTEIDFFFAHAAKFSEEVKAVLVDILVDQPEIFPSLSEISRRIEREHEKLNA